MLPILDTKGLKWSIAKKTKPLRAKPMVTLLVDKSVATKFLIDTLEGREPIGPDAMFCIGEGGDAWQQTPSKLLKKYDVTDIDTDGWMVCTPKSENSVEFFVVTREWLQLNAPHIPDGYGYVVGTWGETIDGNVNLQKFFAGDAIVRNREDTIDQWVVRRKIWNNSYTEIGG